MTIDDENKIPIFGWVLGSLGLIPFIVTVVCSLAFPKHDFNKDIIQFLALYAAIIVSF